MEKDTIYAYNLQQIDNPTFDDVRQLARSFVNDMPPKMVNDIYEQLNRGVDALTTELQMLVYLHAFGNMHQAKLDRAFEEINDVLSVLPEIDIIDYGCGQGIGSMCFADYIANHCETKVRSVTLIEPSAICLNRAALHISVFLPKTKIRTICKSFDILTTSDLSNNGCGVTLHILSNVLDMPSFDIDRFANLIRSNLQGYNLFVCVGPYFNYSDKDNRMPYFSSIFANKTIFNRCFDKGELNNSKNWTAQIVCFETGNMSYAEKLSAEATKEEINAGIEDEYGVVYSRDGSRLLKFKNKELVCYEIKEGTKVICDYAFCDLADKGQAFGGFPLRFMKINPFFRLKQITIPDTVTNIGVGAFEECESLEKINIPNSIKNIGNRAFLRCRSLKYIELPDSVISIGDEAFSECASLTINVPRSVNHIGYLGFNDCLYIKECNSDNYIVDGKMLIDKREGTINSFMGASESIIIPNSVTRLYEFYPFFPTNFRQITIPDSVKSIEESTFDNCDYLEHIIISKESAEKFKRMLPAKLWNKLYFLEKVVSDNELESNRNYYEPRMSADDLPF